MGAKQGAQVIIVLKAKSCSEPSPNRKVSSGGSYQILVV